MLIKRIFHIITGLISIVLGLIAFLIPGIPGFILVFFGIILISPHHGRRGVEWAKSKFRRKGKSEKSSEEN